MPDAITINFEPEIIAVEVRPDVFANVDIVEAKYALDGIIKRIGGDASKQELLLEIIEWFRVTYKYPMTQTQAYRFVFAVEHGYSLLKKKLLDMLDSPTSTTSIPARSRRRPLRRIWTWLRSFVRKENSPPAMLQVR
jgi:hypothetical protein